MTGTMTPEAAFIFLRKQAYRWAEQSKDSAQEERRSMRIEQATAVLEKALPQR